jgi:hypothetical protein
MRGCPVGTFLGRSGAAFALGFVLILGATPARAIRCATPDLNRYRSEVRPLPASAMVPSHQPGDPRTPPDNPQVGDSWLWYTWLLNGYPTPVQRMCTVRGEGNTCYVVVEDSQWGTRVDQADVDAIVNAWDNQSLGQWPNEGIYQLDTENFGPAPDELDNDPKIYILYYAFDISADGFFWLYDEYPDGSQPFASNECEVLYMNSAMFDPGGTYLISVQAHEFQHMIHWLADENEDNWLNEGMSELAMWDYGAPDDVVQFPNSPDNNLTSWSGNFYDYVKVYLWSLYFYEHFGGQPTIRDLVARTTNGLTSVGQTMAAMGYTTTVPEEIRNWVTANFLDDPNLDGGLYNFAGETLPPFAAVTKSTYPVPLTNASVNHYAADYIKFVSGQPQRLTFDGTDSSTWYAMVIKYLSGTPLSVEEMPLDPGTKAGYLDLPAFGTDYDQVVLVVANAAPGSGVVSYQYGTSDIPASAEGDFASGGMRLEPAGANPVTASADLRLVLDRPAAVRAGIYDASGVLVRELPARPLAVGASALHWDLHDASGDRAPAGVYFIRAQADDGRTAERKVVVLR